MNNSHEHEVIISKKEREYAGLRALAISSFVLGMINLLGIVVLALSIKN